MKAAAPAPFNNALSAGICSSLGLLLDNATKHQAFPARIPVSPSHGQGDCPLSQPKLTQVYTSSLSGMSLAFKVTIKKGKLDDSV